MACCQQENVLLIHEHAPVLGLRHDVREEALVLRQGGVTARLHNERVVVQVPVRCVVRGTPNHTAGQQHQHGT